MHSILPRLKIYLFNNIMTYIRYNDFNEYSYQIIFSNTKNDWVRFDNYDNIWEVRTKPNHKHCRSTSEVKESPMIGDPEKDILLLVNELLIHYE